MLEKAYYNLKSCKGMGDSEEVLGAGAHDVQGKAERASPSHPVEEKVKVLLSTAT